jgi:putative two-component system response regulator
MSPYEVMPPAHILVVDDDAAVRRSIVRFLQRGGHMVEEAGSVAEALLRLDVAPCDVLVTDLRMPGSSGLELLAETRRRWPHVRAMLMSGAADAADAAVAIEHGVERLFLKPVPLNELAAAVDKVQRDHGAARAAAQERELESRGWILRATQALTAAVEAKDAYTAGHAVRVSAYGVELARVIGGIDLDRFALAGGLHDIGKIGVPDAVLNKPGPLTPDEEALVRLHPEAGERILGVLIDDPVVLGVVRWHHEHWDGTGYPDRLAGSAIPLEARVLATADALDALTSQRAYRPSRSWDAAVAEIRRSAGTHFDPGAVAALDAALPALAELHDRLRPPRLHG